MSKFIEVTNSEGKVLVNVDKILYVSDHTTNACIRLGEKVALHVKETYREIKAMLEVVNDQRELPAPMKYFSYDPSDVDGLELHHTSDEAKLRAQSCIPEMLDCNGRWEERVDLVCWGEVKEITTKTNVRPDPSGENDYLCDYKLKPIGVDQTIQQPESNNGD